MAGGRWLTFVWLPDTERPDLLTDADWRRVERELLANPQAGRVIKGMGGARKLRVRIAGRGKAGGARTIYYYVAPHGRIYFLATYAKNEQADLSERDRQAIQALLALLDAPHGG